MRKGSENQIIQFLLADGKIRGAIMDSSLLVKEMAEFHGFGPVESLIAGQMISAVALMSVTIKGNDRMRLSLECGGPIGGFHADWNANGDVRGGLQNNPIEMNASKEVTIDNLYGPGFLHIMRSSEGSTTPFTGSVELRYPDLASNLAYYYLSSEQTPTAFTLSVDIDPSGTLLGAACLFLQVLPGADEGVLERLHEELLQKKSLYKEIIECGDAGEWINTQLESFSPIIIGLKNVRFFCPCERSQIQQFLVGLGEEKAQGLIEESEKQGEDCEIPKGKGLSVKCHSCSEEHFFSEEDLKKLLRGDK